MGGLVITLFLLGVLLWIAGKTREHLQGSPRPPATAPVIGSASTSTQDAAPPSTVTVTPEFQQLLDVFRTQYLEYKMNGTPASRAAYEAAQASIEQQLTSLQTQVDTTATDIQTFVDDYVDANPELISLQSQLKTIQRESPGLENRLETEKRASDEVSAIDVSLYYSRGFIVLSALAILGAIAFTE
jgi:hypothetical protein